MPVPKKGIAVCILTSLALLLLSFENKWMGSVFGRKVLVKAQLQDLNQRPIVFIGVLSGPEETQRRMAFRSQCVPKWKHAIDAGLLFWRFFVGEPESRTEVNRFFSHTQGAKASKQAHDEAMNILNETIVYKDIEVGAYGDHYVTRTRKVNEILRIASSPEEGWNPDFIVKLDSTFCFDYDQFASAVREYNQVYRTQGLTASKDQPTRGNVSLELIYRPELGIISDKNFADIKSEKGLPGNAPPAYNFPKKSLNGLPQPQLMYATHTNFSRALFPIFSGSWFSKPDLKTHLGYDNTFEPYPSGNCYVLPTELVRIMLLPSDRAHTLLSLETLGTTNEDVTLGHLLSRTADAHRLLLDLVSVHRMIFDISMSTLS